MASFVYNSGKVKLGDGSIDWDTDTIKVSLHTSTYSPDVDNDVFFSDTSNELSGGGYTSGGNTLDNCAVTQDNTNDRAIYDADDETFAAFTGTFRYLVVYKDTGVAATSPLICVIDLGSDETITNGSYDITWSAGGVFNLN